MPVQMWDVNKCLFCIIVMSLTGSTAVEKEFFQSEEATFQCEHNLAVAELLQVEWKKYAESCALMDLNNGNVVRIKYPCGWEARANMTATNVTIFSLEPSDDGEFSCTALKSGYVPVNGARFNLTVNVKAENHLLLLDGTQHSCDSPVTVDTAETSTLTCSVDSKPEANFTWSSQPGLTNSLVGSTTCNQRSDKVYHCTNTLTLQNSVIPTSGVTVTCHVEAFGNTTNLCMKLGRSDAGSARQLCYWSGAMVLFLVWCSLVLPHTL